MRTPTIALATALAAFAIGQPVPAAEPLRLFLEAAPGSSASSDVLPLSPAQRNRLARLGADPAAVATSVVRLTPGVLSATALSLNVPGRAPQVIAKQAADAASWRGTDAAADVTLARGRDGITGSLRIAGKSFALRPIGGGLHAFVERDFSRLPPEHPPGAEGLPVPPAARPGAEATDDAARRTARAAPITYRVLVAYTRQAELAVGDMAGLATLAVAETNAAYANSSVVARAELAGLLRVNGTESSSISSDLMALQRSGDGRFDEVHARRNQSAADVVVLISTHRDACGVGYLNASASYAFSVVSHGCATGYYSFAHEIGHNQGARHNPEQDPSSSPYPYGHGYYDTTGRFRTVMSYACPVGCRRIPYFSNPAVSYLGRPTGTATRHNNARVLNETASRVAAFRAAPMP